MIPLLITDAIYGFFFVITALFGIWVYLKSSRKTSHILFLLLTLAIGIYQVSYAIGTGTADPEASRTILMLSLSLICVIALTAHWIAAILEKVKEYRSTIIGLYAVGVALIVLYVLRPDGFILASAPKLYFPDYYQAGDLFWLFVFYFAAGFGLIMRMLIKSYAMSDAAHRNRLAYYMAAILIGFPLCATSFFLAYDIPFDPIYSSLFNLSIVPLAYGTLRYDIMDIKQAARRALGYALFVIGTGLFIVGAEAGNSLLLAFYPTAPSWLVPLAASLVIVFFGGYIWEKMRELENLKYEFITVVTHKFRTPLTRIKWASEIIERQAASATDPGSARERAAIGEIEDASEHLVGLTDMLVSLQRASGSSYGYEFEATDPCELVAKAVQGIRERAQDKRVSVALSCPPKSAAVSVDRRRMAFALQIIAENAVTYTPEGGDVSVSVSHDASGVYIEVKDSGIGIAKEDLPRMFSKFWRSAAAKTVDTEGMGIGLFMAREIIERHDGQIWARSEGVGRGSLFTIRLPLAKE
ncbi:MAG: hypothetical protein KGI79_01165 [Patescibacteria group bacterium]|nr:hypothetical protein [Patescibacteria group bacterium]MDE2116467.1 hypothetical protein [Patescibacteria group bacterium]